MNSNVTESSDCIVPGIHEDASKAYALYIQNNPAADAIAQGAGTLANAKGVFCAK